jgi:ferrous iron transport protein A
LPYAGVVTLNQVPVGTSARLVDVSDHPGSRRLAELGLRPGAQVHVMRRTSGGGRLVGLGPSRMALDSATATALQVELAS